MFDNQSSVQPASITINPINSFTCAVDVPGSKSLTNRALLIAALAKGTSNLSNVLFADDTGRMIDCLQALGFELEIDEPNCKLTVQGAGGIAPNEKAFLHVGNAGTAMRSLAAFCALAKGEFEIDGIERMRQRPIGALIDNLRTLGADIEYLDKQGFPPLRISGGSLSGAKLDMKPAQSSQFITALMIIAPLLEPDGLELCFNSAIISLPYVKMTAQIMRDFGAAVEADDSWQNIKIPFAKDGYIPRDYVIEPDASNASYFLGAGAIVPASSCTVNGLGAKSTQGDVRFAGVLEKMGAKVAIENQSITVAAPDEKTGLTGIDIDLNHMPDMAQTLAAVALFAKGTTTIRNVGNLKVKETDRIAALENELTKLGAAVKTTDDSIRIVPPKTIKPASIATYDDHRMAMSMAIVGLAAKGVTIEDPACVNKTFPKFFEVLERLN